jgi:DNA polymerase-1
LLLLDGHSLAYRAFFALPVENFSTRTGQPTNAVFGFTSMLINMLRDEQPTHIVVAFDVSRQSFRSEKYAEYKAGRSETPKPFQGQVSLIKEVLEALRIPVVEKPGYAARSPARPGSRAWTWSSPAVTGTRSSSRMSTSRSSIRCAACPRCGG